MVFDFDIKPFKLLALPLRWKLVVEGSYPNSALCAGCM